MKIRLSQLRQRLDDYQLPLETVAARALRVRPQDILATRLVRKSVDARDKGDVHFTLTLEVETARPVRLPKGAEEITAGGAGSLPPHRNGEVDRAAGRWGTSEALRDGEGTGDPYPPLRGDFPTAVGKLRRDGESPSAVGKLRRGGESPSAVGKQENGGESSPAVGNLRRDGASAVLGTRRAATPGRALVVGMGPAGLFAALTLARAGLRPLVVERGKPVDDRERDVAAFWNGGPFNPDSNVQFGEGGAGTFSDGKLNSGIHDPRCRAVLEEMHRAGAPESILWQAKPHVGTDHLKRMVKRLREEILARGGDVRFETRLTGLRIENGAVTGATLAGPGGADEVEVGAVILAVGHSARDTFEMLHRAGVELSRKPFAIGARIEHNQRWLNRAQYGPAADHPALGAADYKLAVHLENGRSVYTFCMCPGGQVVAAASEAGGVVVNGMSLYARDGENANSAVLVNVLPEDFGGEDPLAGVRFQRKWEQAAFEAGGGNYRAPAQRVGDFLQGRASRGPGAVTPSYRPGVTWTALDGCLPEFVTDALRRGLPLLDRKLKGFASPDAVLTGVETRSSSPVRIERGPDCAATRVRGLYPCGEGAGYAGGILSAAVDGIRCAERVILQEKP